MTRPTLTQIRQLDAMHRQRVPAAYMDENGHMNVQYYLHVMERGLTELYRRTGMGDYYASADVYGNFALQQHILYLAEVRQDDHISVHPRLAALSPKRSQMFGFLVNDTRDELAATLETVAMNIDMTRRRGTPFPAEAMMLLRRMLARHAELGWEAPVCGLLRV